MEIRPHRLIKRKKTKKIKVGNVYVGGDAVISVQSMTNTLTTDVKATINQINEICEQLQAYHYHIDYAPLYEKKVMREDIFHNDNFLEFRK